MSLPVSSHKPTWVKTLQMGIYNYVCWDSDVPSKGKRLLHPQPMKMDFSGQTTYWSSFEKS
jgi:hypothetical protein